MRSFLTILVFFFCGIQKCNAQDTTIVLKASMLNKFNGQISLSTLDGWILSMKTIAVFQK